MKQELYTLESKAALAAVLPEVADSAAYQTASSVVVHLLTNRLSAAEAADALSMVRAALPRAQTAGMSVVKLRAEEKREPKSLQLCVCYFRHSVAEMREYGPEEDMKALGAKIAAELNTHPEVKGVGVYHGGSAVGVEDFLSAASKGHEDIPFFGTQILMRNPDFDRYARHVRLANHAFFQETTRRWGDIFVIGETVRDFGLVLVFFKGDDLHIKVDIIAGWKPLGRDLVVTETADEFIATKINDMPATEIYHKYLQVKPDEYFIFNICEFPLMMKQGDRLVPRVPPEYDEQRRLYFIGHIRQGDCFRLTYGNSVDILENTWKASEEMRLFGPEHVLLISCAHRDLFLKEQAHYEADMYGRFSSMTVLSSGGELYRRDGYGGIFNSTLIAVGMREGEAKVANPSACPLSDLAAETHVVPLSARLAAFVEVTSQELVEEMKKARAANEAKSQFLSNMSHEIRTPINAIMGMDEMILREARDEDIRAYAENIRAASASLLGIVNNILDFSKIEAGKMEILPVEYELSSMLNDLVNMVRTRAEKKGLTLQVEASPELPSLLFGDEIRIKQVATNLLTNAVKYTETGGVTLRVSFEKADCHTIRLSFAVEDTGIGIRPGDLGKLFNPFERIEEARNRTIEGTGLGMNITKRLLEMMGSRLEVESEYGKGSVFSFTVGQRVVNWEPIGDFEQAYRHTLAHHHSYHECFSAPEAKVLVVDDTEMNLTVIRNLLKTTKVQLDEAESGAACLALTREKKYDLIFLDHRMPGMDGVETLEALRQQAGGQNEQTPVICLTANAISGAREWYLGQGFNDYLMKPVSGRQLEAMLLKYLPPERVSRTDDCIYKAVRDESLPAWLLAISHLDTHLGLKNCGSNEDYLTALRIFQESAPDTANAIEGFFRAKDWENYTTKVHALKSSARIVGAAELSERAERLEDAGNRRYIEEIEKDTPMLLALYRTCSEALAPLDVPAKEETANLPEIDRATLHEAYAAIGEMAASFDYDAIQFILADLAQSRVPEDEAERYARLAAAAKKPDWDTLEKILAEP